MHAPPGLVLAALVTMHGCDAGAGATATGSVSDSAGVPVVVNPATAPATWRLSAQPSLEIGGAEGLPHDLLYQAFDALVLGDGTVVVANVGTSEIRFYDAEGRHLRSVGGAGEAPGEFVRLRLVGRFGGDSLLAYDTGLRRVTVLGPEGELARTWTLDEERQATRATGVLADGSLVVARNPYRGLQSGVTRTPWILDVLTSTGELRTSLGQFPGQESSSAVSPTGGYAGVGVPLARDVYHAAAGDRIVVGTSDAFSIRHYSGDGSLVRLIRQDREPVPVDPAELQPMIDRMRPEPGSGLADLREQAIAQIPLHTTRPAFRALVVDRTGNVWVREHEGTGPRSEAWQVFDRNGLLVGRIVLPVDLEVRDAGEDYLLGVARDDLGVERLRLYGLAKEGAGGRP